MEGMLNHYRQIDIIRNADRSFIENTGIIPYDISHWNAGNEYKKIIMQLLNLPTITDYMDYKYSYSFNSELKSKILMKHNLPNSEVVFFNSATSAISTICTTLKAMSFRKICLLCPAYFSVYESFKILNFDVKCINYKYDGKYHIPFEMIEKEAEIIWITQPVFSTGTYIDDSELQKLFNMPQIIICDGSMCNAINSQSNFIADCNKNIFLYSPQKIIGLNCMKFCYVLCNSIIAKKIEDWGDVVAGGLLSSSMMAIKHYLSPNYVSCLNAHNKYIHKSHSIIDSVILNNNECISKCGQSLNNTYETLTINQFPFTTNVSLDFMYNFICKTHVTLLPGCVNGFDYQNGFCFRINHTLDIMSNYAALNRIISYLHD